MSSPALVRLAIKYRDEQNRIRATASAAAVKAWRRLEHTNKADLERLLIELRPVDMAAVIALVRLAAGFVGAADRLDSLADAGPVVRVAELDPAKFTNPARFEQAVTAPFHKLWGELAAGVVWATAKENAEPRLAGGIVSHLGDVSLDASTAAMGQSDRIIGYRRTLTGGGCTFCTLAAQQTYSTQDLMPLHRDCDCGVAPIYANADPGKDVNQKFGSSSESDEPATVS